MKISLTYTQIFLQVSILSLLLFFSNIPQFSLLSFPLILSLLFLYFVYIYFLKPYPIFLLDYACYKPSDDRKCNYQLSEQFVTKSNSFSQKSIDFMYNILIKSGLGEETYAPPFIFQGLNVATLDSAWVEAKEGMFSAVDSVLSTTKIDPCKDIDIVIVTCGSFSPSPSLSSLLVNHYKMGPTVQTYNLSGMGCGSGILAIDMASHLLRGSGPKNVRNVLVVITENISLNWYFGDDRSMLVTNCLFRVGCAAAIITNDPNRASQARFELVQSVRTHHGADDSSYKAAFQEEDGKGNTGVSLTKDLIRVAGHNLRAHIKVLAPRVLPLSQLVQYVRSVVLNGLTQGQSKPMVPDFTTAFEHICIHTGGKAVIGQVEKLLKLDDVIVEPAKMTLHRFGNTSSSLVFYELAYFDAKQRIKKGDRVWMIAFGTGFKIGSLVWKALKDSRSHNHPSNPWNDCIHNYPLSSW